MYVLAYVLQSAQEDPQRESVEKVVRRKRKLLFAVAIKKTDNTTCDYHIGRWRGDPEPGRADENDRLRCLLDDLLRVPSHQRRLY